MTTAPAAPTEQAHTTTPTLTLTPHTYECSDCLTPTRASEVHGLIDEDWVAYCARCAHTFRRYARVVLPARVAHQRGIQVTL